jgi:hypothetical protein
MARPKGKPKTGGRVKGTLNKRSSLLANELEERGFSFSNELIKVYKALDADKKAYFLLKMMDFMYHKPVPCEDSKIAYRDKSECRYYKDENGMDMYESTVTNSDGSTFKVVIPDNGSAVDSPRRLSLTD